MKIILKYTGYSIIGVILGFILGLILVAAHSDGEDILAGIYGNRNDNPILGLEIGSDTPDFQLYSYNGDLIKLSDFTGEPVVINFWATWCAPCVIEMPLLQTRYDAFDSNLNIIAVNAGESKSTVEKFVRENGITFPTLLDSTQAVQKIYHVRAYPTTYFIDENGVIQAVHIGILTEKQLDNNLSVIGEFD